MDIKKYISEEFIKGNGIEIGALHRPFPVAAGTVVTYVDRLPVAELRKHYPELAEFVLAEVGILDDGETLSKVADESQDFVIGSHLLEHCQDPILAISNMVRVTREGGVVYLSIPDKNYTFDVFRPVTRLEHLVKDYENGAQLSRQEHYYEYARWVSKGIKREDIGPHIQRLQETGYSIHYHAWRQSEILELIAYLVREKKMPIMCEAILRGEVELHVVLKKTSALGYLEKLAEMARTLEDASPGAEEAFAFRRELAIGFAEVGQNHAAECLYNEALSFKPDHIEALIGMGVAQLKNGKLEAAKSTIGKAQKLDPSNESIGRLLGQILDAMKNINAG